MRTHPKKLPAISRTETGWQTADGRTVTEDALKERENNILQFAVARIFRHRPGWIKRYGMFRNVSLRNLAKLELND